MSIDSIRLAFAISIAFSAVPPTPIPMTPGGHQPAPIVGIIFNTQSVTLSSGCKTANFALFSDPQPLAATIKSTLLPNTTFMWMTAGVLSLVLVLLKSGSSTIEARKGLFSLVKARLTPSLIISSNDKSAAHTTSIPTSTNTLTMPVS
ncbi:hypothetical protein [uncultured Gammaproteobacteria bacterium]|nr:hypothetical protein [uncultured Gammaproteobacteria bacterium]